MIKRNILDCMTLVGGTPLRFEGEKTYVSTGAVDCDHVDYAQTERVTYDNRPSRANLSVAEGDILFAKMCGTKRPYVSTGRCLNIYILQGFVQYELTSP